VIFCFPWRGQTRGTLGNRVLRRMFGIIRRFDRLQWLLVLWSILPGLISLVCRSYRSRVS
jgi:hypothetical protein